MLTEQYLRRIKKALKLSLFSKATIPEKYFEKFLVSKLFELLLLEYKGVW